MRAGRCCWSPDTCEHLAAGCADVLANLLAEHPRLTVVATSREALGVPGEGRVRVDPLPVGTPDAPSAAERLFVERAREAAHDVRPDGHPELVGELCAALDGLPLAIELAAQHCAFRPLTAVPATLDRRERLEAVGETGAVHELLVAGFAGRAQGVLTRAGRAKDPDEWAWDLGAIESYRYAATVAREAGDPRFGALAAATAVLLNDSGHGGAGRAVVEQALAQPGLQPRDQARLLMAGSVAFTLGGDRAAALSRAERAYRITVDLGDQPLLFQARTGWPGPPVPRSCSTMSKVLR